jgi:hypothetical protein
MSSREHRSVGLGGVAHRKERKPETIRVRKMSGAVRVLLCGMVVNVEALTAFWLVMVGSVGCRLDRLE